MSSEGYREKFLASNTDAECVVCGTDDKIFVHHINGDQSGDSMSNLTSLYPSCHRTVHSHTSYGDQIDRFTEQLPESAVNHGPYSKNKSEAVLDVMKDKLRANPCLVRERTGLEKGTVNIALVTLMRRGEIRTVTRGLYEYVGSEDNNE